jgi:hypothetical protein
MGKLLAIVAICIASATAVTASAADQILKSAPAADAAPAAGEIKKEDLTPARKNVAGKKRSKKSGAKAGDNNNAGAGASKKK